MTGDLRRPGDIPEKAEHAGDFGRLSDLYADRGDDIFDGAEDQKARDHSDINNLDTLDDSSDNNAEVSFPFDPRRAGLEDISAEEAGKYIAQNKDARPWLAAAADRPPQVQRVYAALDRGQGHAIPRHDDYGDDMTYERRVRYLEDPAQLDDVKRAAGIDGTKPGDKKHVCAEYAARIHHPDAFAATFARGTEHPAIRAVLDRRYDADWRPDDVRVPISDLLGPDGHLSCTGFRLVGDDPDKARRDRKAWLAGERRDDLAAPVVEPIPTFEGGEIEFRFRRNRAGDGYEVSTMFPQPPEDPNERRNT